MTRFFHGAAQFWRGGAVVALLVLGGFLYYASTQPEVYESDTLVELTNDRASDGSAVGNEGLRAAVFDPKTIEQVALDTAPHVQRDADKPGASVIERTRHAIDLRPAGDARFTITFRASTGASARHGCEAVVGAASQRMVALHPPSSPQDEARQRTRAVEEKTRELAAFVAQHPELAAKKGDTGEAFLGVPGMRPPSTPAPAPTTDTVLPILVQQKARLEERIAFVEKVELGGADESQDKLPANDALARMDRASLQKMLVQVKAAIAARQAAAERARANSPNENSQEGTASAVESTPAVQVEWQRLVQAVVDAQQQAAQGRDGGMTSALHVVRSASTPASPILPNRRLLALLGVTIGLWAGILWAFTRVLLGHAQMLTPTQYLPEGLPAFPLEGEPSSVPAETTSAGRLAAAKPVTAPSSAVATPLPAPSTTATSEAAAPAKTAALPSFPMDADSAKAAAEATSGSRPAAAKAAPALPTIPANTKSAPTPAHPKPAVHPAPLGTTPAAPPVASGAAIVTPLPAVAPAPPAVVPAAATPAPPAVTPVAAAPTPAPPAVTTVGAPAAPPAVTSVAAVPIAASAVATASTVTASGGEPPPPPGKMREALPSFPMEAELAEVVTSISRPPPAHSDSESDSLPKVIIAAEATEVVTTLGADDVLAAEPKSDEQPDSPIDVQTAQAIDAAAAEPAVQAVEPAERAPSAAEKGFPVLVVDGAQSTSVAPNAAATRSPYAAPEPRRSGSDAEGADAARRPAGDARVPGRHHSWYGDASTSRGASRSTQGHAVRGSSAETSASADADATAGRIEASPIMGIEEGMSTAASGKQGISVYPPPVAPVGGPVTAAGSPGATMRMGSVAPHEAASGSGHPGRRVTQVLGTPLGMTASTAPSFGWTPPPAFGAHHVPPRDSDPPPGLASIPPPPKNPTHIGHVPSGTSARHTSAAAQSHPVTPGRANARSPAQAAETPSTALAVVRSRPAYSRSEPPAASSVICDVPKGWSPHPTLTDETSEELVALRDQLYRLAARECFVVGVSSGPEMAAYKSGVAGRLAWMLAQPGHVRVLLMEGDFDHPVVHRLMRIDMPLASGFSEQMRKRMNGTSAGPWTIVRCAPNLYVLAEGLVRSPGLLPTVHFADSVSELRRAYDLIVIDGPAGGMSVDTRAIDAVADGIVLAGESDLLDRASAWFGKKQLMAVVSAGHAAPRAR